MNTYAEYKMMDHLHNWVNWLITIALYSSVTRSTLEYWMWMLFTAFCGFFSGFLCCMYNHIEKHLECDFYVHTAVSSVSRSHPHTSTCILLILTKCESQPGTTTHCSISPFQQYITFTARWCEAQCDTLSMYFHDQIRESNTGAGRKSVVPLWRLVSRHISGIQEFSFVFHQRARTHYIPIILFSSYSWTRSPMLRNSWLKLARPMIVDLSAQTVVFGVIFKYSCLAVSVHRETATARSQGFWRRWKTTQNCGQTLRCKPIYLFMRRGDPERP